MNMNMNMGGDSNNMVSGAMNYNLNMHHRGGGGMVDHGVGWRGTEDPPGCHGNTDGRLSISVWKKHV